MSSDWSYCGSGNDTVIRWVGQDFNINTYTVSVRAGNHADQFGAEISGSFNVETTGVAGPTESN